jgi:hypothetical protein
VVSQSFLDGAIQEYQQRVYGEYTEQVLQMWITQNEP